MSANWSTYFAKSVTQRDGKEIIIPRKVLKLATWDFYINTSQIPTCPIDPNDTCLIELLLISWAKRLEMLELESPVCCCSLQINALEQNMWLGREVGGRWRLRTCRAWFCRGKSCAGLHQVNLVHVENWTLLVVVCFEWVRWCSAKDMTIGVTWLASILISIVNLWVFHDPAFVWPQKRWSLDIDMCGASGCKKWWGKCSQQKLWAFLGGYRRRAHQAPDLGHCRPRSF